MNKEFSKDYLLGKGGRQTSESIIEFDFSAICELALFEFKVDENGIPCKGRSRTIYFSDIATRELYKDLSGKLWYDLDEGKMKSSGISEIEFSCIVYLLEYDYTHDVPYAEFMGLKKKCVEDSIKTRS